MDILSGGAGVDTFYIGYSIDGRQTIKDLEPGEIIFIFDDDFTTNPGGCQYLGRITYEDIVDGLGGVPIGDITTEVMTGTGGTEICAVKEGDTLETCFTTPITCVKFGDNQVPNMINGDTNVNNYIEDKTDPSTVTSI